ncbi:hypothetical protein [Gallaecimonas mangrovi]|uniref:hypothetical protein n=1 Tax=Gallaecimonas mangrovi TaxID=2291597 RepID=UPI000E1FC89A|nr:hypothetical protein [Gallaecimonas mangrovi]
MGKKSLILLLLVAAWLYFAFGSHWHHSFITFNGDDWQWHSANPLAGVAVAGLALLVALLAVGGTLVGVVVLLAFIALSVFFGLAFVAIPLWVPIVVIWLLVRPTRRPSAG